MISHAALNAILNGISGILLACGYAAIRNGKVQIHKRFMISAFAVSTVSCFPTCCTTTVLAMSRFMDKAGYARFISCC
jgi:uncharacterized membrane protein YozB (DUF420 family)